MSKIQSLLQITPKDTFYNSKEEIIANSKAMHKELMERDRELYTYLLYFTNSTYYSKSEIIMSLLSKSLYLEDKATLENLLKYEDALIHYALFNENATHAIKMLLSLKTNKVNNSRTTNIILDFIFNRGNADFLAVKYRNKIKQLLIHALGLANINKILADTVDGKKIFKKYIGRYNNPYAKEVFMFVCGKVSDINKETSSQYINDYIKAEKEFSSKDFNHRNLKGTSLPIEVLIGFNNYYKKYLDISIIMGLGKASDKQKIQLQNAVKKASNDTVEIKIDFSKYSLIDLYKYLYNKEELEETERDEILSQIDIKAKEIALSTPDFDPVELYKDKIAIILDLSDSNCGSLENPNAPLYKNLLLHKILTSYESMKDSKTYYVGGKFNEDKQVYETEGDTNIAGAVIQAAIDGYKKVMILSDGFENIGNTEDAYDKLQKLYSDFTIVHFNPVFSPKDFSCKKLGDDITAIPFIGEKDLVNMILFTILADNEEEFKKAVKSKIDKEILKEE